MNTQQAESGHQQEQEHPHKIRIEVVYNGVERPLEVQPHELIRAVLEHAIHLFKVVDQPHRLSLFRADGTKLEERESVAAAGLHEGAVIYLRHDVVKGGRA